MIRDDFEEAKERIRDAMRGLVKPSIFFKNQITHKPLSLNRRMRFGMGVYMIMTGPPGTGKTALVDSEFVLNPIFDHVIDPEKYADILCIYRSMERPSVEKTVKFMAYMIYVGTEGKVVIDIPTFLQYSNKKRLLTKDDWTLVESLDEYIDAVVKSLDLVSESDTPDGIKKYLENVLHRNGQYIKGTLDGVYVNGIKIDKKYDLVDPEGNPYCVLKWKNGKEIKVNPGYGRFFCKKPNKIIMTVNDTVDRIRVPYGSNVLDTSNAHTFNMAEFRKAEALGIIDIKQFSKESEKDFRSKNNTALSVGLSDIKGSGDFGQNADLGISVLDPAYFNVKKWGGDPDGAWDDMDFERFHGAGRIPGP